VRRRVLAARRVGAGVVIPDAERAMRNLFIEAVALESRLRGNDRFRRRGTDPPPLRREAAVSTHLWSVRVIYRNSVRLSRNVFQAGVPSREASDCSRAGLWKSYMMQLADKAPVATGSPMRSFPARATAEIVFKEKSDENVFRVFRVKG
jgi:hypothetical protein